MARFQQNPRITSPHYLGHASEIILPFHRAHAISPVIILVWHAVSETNHRRNDMGGGNVRDIEAFHHARHAGELQRIRQHPNVRHRVDCAWQTATGKAADRLRRTAQIFNHVAQFGCLFEIHFLRGLAHFLFQRGDHLPRMPLKKFAPVDDALAVLLDANLAQTHRHLISGRF